uniref:Transposase n=1 Tax=Meloidogyne javanica TaxID=6303 RepID=A0A915M9Y1_MELJA
MHLKNKHPNLFKQREDYVAEERKKKENIRKQEDNPLKRSFAKAQLQESDPSQKCHSPDILETLKATKSGAWDRNGSSFKEANRGLIEMIAAGILPFSLVEQPGFVRFCKIIQPRYNPPGRKHFTQVELQSAYDDMKVRIINDLSSIDYFSITTDGWTAKGNTHSLISITAVVKA